MGNIAVFGLSGNPPQRGHAAIIQSLIDLPWIDHVLVIPCGGRPTKRHLVAPEHRLAMTRLMCDELAFPERITVSDKDVHLPRYTPTVELADRLRADAPQPTYWLVIGTDLLAPLSPDDPRCEIEASWVDGERLLAEYSFLVVRRPGFNKKLRLPERHEFIDLESPESSTLVRLLAAEGKSFDHLVPPAVATYIKAHRLYFPPPQGLRT